MAVDFSGRSDVVACAGLDRPTDDCGEYTDGNSPHAVSTLRADGDIGVGGGAFGMQRGVPVSPASSDEAEEAASSSSSQESATGRPLGRVRSFSDMSRDSKEAAMPGRDQLVSDCRW